VHTLALTVNYSNTGNSAATSCDTYTWTGTTYTTSGSYVKTFTNVAGCDSVHALALTVNYSNTGNSAATSCDTYTWTGTTYNASGSYVKTFTNAVGCDSVHLLALTINYSSSSSAVATGCSSYTWLSPGTGLTYTSSGTYSTTLSNASGCDSVISINLTLTPCDLQLKLYFEGYYVQNGYMTSVLLNEGVSNDPNVVDTITVVLHEINYPNNAVGIYPAVLYTNGSATCTPAGISGDYYIEINHRNGVRTWSAAPVHFGSGTVNYDFSDSVTKAFGDNMIEVETGIWAFYSGDINIDENIDLNDIVLVETGVSNFDYGYVSTDINGDGNVDILDMIVLEANTSNFIYSVHP
jgi:hypothetical protein